MVYQGDCATIILILENMMNHTKSIVEQENLNLSLVDILQSVIRNRWLVLFIFLICLCIAAFFTYIEKPNFETKLLMQVDTQKSNLTQELVSKLTNQAQSGDGAAIQIALIRSRFILEPVIKQIGLNINYMAYKGFNFKNIFNKKIEKFYLPKFEIPSSDFNKEFQIIFDAPNHLRLLSDSGEEILAGKTGTLLTDKTGLYQLKTKNQNYNLGTKFYIQKTPSLNALESLLADLKIEQLGERGVQSTGILQLSIIGHDVEKIKRILNTIAKITQKKDILKKSQEAAKTLAFLHIQLPITQKQLQEAEKKLNLYRAESGKIDIKVQTQFLLQKMVQIDNELEKLNLKHMTMLSRFTDKHPQMQNLVHRINGIKKQRYILEKNLKKLPAADQIAVNLLRDVNVKKMLYLNLLGKIQELEVIRAGTLSSIHLLTNASTPENPLPSHGKVYLLLALISATLISALLIILKNILYSKIEDPHWIERHYDIPNLAIIPYAKEQAIRTISLNDKNYILLAHEQPRVLAIEALRSLRTSIQVKLLTSNNNVISIMGIAPGVGKSFISSNLAYLMAAAGKRVLLIDADLRKGTIHKYMHLNTSSGFAEVLDEKISYNNAIIRNVFPKLDVLVRGNYPKNPSELLMKPILKTMIEDLSLQYDLIIVDTAPVLMVTDATVIGALCAHNYLIIGAKNHQSVEIDLVMKRLRASAVNVQGTIFNVCKKELYQNVLGRYARYGQYYYYNNYSNYYAD